MDFIVASKTGKELKYLPETTNLDIDIGDTNDFELSINLFEWINNAYEIGSLLYLEGTEYGGIMEYLKVITKTNTVVVKGYTWRGLMAQKVIYPPKNQAHYVVSGEANAIIGEIMTQKFGNLFAADTTSSGIVILPYEFERYTDVLTGLTKMLATANARLKICFKKGKVQVGAEPIVDYSNTLEYGSDQKINFEVQDYSMGTNHMVCLGKGDLLEKMVRHLYVQADGSIGNTPYYIGIAEREAVLDASNAEDEKSLIEAGMEKLEEQKNYKKMEISIEDIPVELGDIVGGRERLTGIYLKEPVTQKIVKINGKEEIIEYKVGK